MRKTPRNGRSASLSCVAGPSCSSSSRATVSLRGSRSLSQRSEQSTRPKTVRSLTRGGGGGEERLREEEEREREEEIDRSTALGFQLTCKPYADLVRNAVVSSESIEHAIREVEFFFPKADKTALSDFGGGGHKRPEKKSEWVSMDALLSFCFPPGVEFPRSTGRLSVVSITSLVVRRNQERCVERMQLLSPRSFSCFAPPCGVVRANLLLKILLRVY